MSGTAITEAFIAKVDAFAATLDPEEQAMLIGLLTDDDDVAGFGFNSGWPGLSTLGVATTMGGTSERYYEGTVATGGVVPTRPDSMGVSTGEPQGFTSF